MKTSYEYTITKILERVTLVTVDGATIEIPIVSNNFEPVFPEDATNEEKTQLRVEARTAFRQEVRKYLIDFFRGKDIEAAQVVTISPTIKTIEGTTQTITV